MSPRRVLRAVTSEIEDMFAPIVGSLVWAVRRGHGSFLTMEFGQPHLLIREPVDSTSEPGSIVHRLLSRRRVSIAGDFHLWIQHARWRLVVGDKACDNDSLPGDIDDVLPILDGQQMTGVVAGRDALVLRFDLGATLQVKYSMNEGAAKLEQWALHRYRGNAVVCFSDGTIVESAGEI
jgi:hypothetical protein